MRVLVCGSRTWANKSRLEYELDDYDQGEAQAICGGISLIIGYDPERKYPPGADEMAYMWAKGKGDTPECFPADWKKYNRAAGFIRNQRMLDEGKPDLVLAFWDGKSRGTRDMIDRARRAGVPVKLVRPDGRSILLSDEWNAD